MKRRHLLSVPLFFMALSAKAQPSISTSRHPREDEAIGFAVALLDTIENGDTASTFDLLAPMLQANLTREKWKAFLDDERLKLGKRTGIKLRRVVWYENPINAPLPGTYAAVEFDSTYQLACSHFQFLILHSQQGAPFRLMRRESDVGLKP